MWTLAVHTTLPKRIVDTKDNKSSMHNNNINNMEVDQIMFENTCNSSPPQVPPTPRHSFMPHESVNSLQLSDLEDLDLMDGDSSHSNGDDNIYPQELEAAMTNPGGLWSAPNKRPSICDESMASQLLRMRGAGFPVPGTATETRSPCPNKDSPNTSGFTVEGALYEQHRCTKRARTSHPGEENHLIDQHQ